MLIASNFLLWIAVALLTIAVVALVRQLRQLAAWSEAGTAASPAAPEPRVGDPSPLRELEAIDGTPVTLAGRPTLLLFVGQDCAISRAILPDAAELAEASGLRLLVAADGDAEERQALAAAHALASAEMLAGSGLRDAFAVGELPAVVLVRADGIVAARGVTDGRAHLERLLRSAGFAPGRVPA